MLSINNKTRLVLTLLFSLTLGFWSCVKTEFDEPPFRGNISVDIQANTTIKQLKALHYSTGGFDKITDDLIIAGEVVMDDRSGNYYKALVIQDATGGIEIDFNDGYLYNSFPIGRTIYIKCKDLILTDYHNLPQLQGSLITQNGVQSAVGLTQSQVLDKVVKGNYATTPLAPKVVTPGDLNKDLLNTLIQLDDVQFVQCDAGKTFADPVTLNSLNRTIENCNGQELLVRSSGYSTFAANTTPVGKGSIVGVLTIYGTDYQLAIRDLNDVKMSGTRCGNGGSGGTATLVDIANVRSLFTGTLTNAPSGLKIKGLVISDRLGKNLNSFNLYLQDASAGILVRFQAAHCFELGDEIEVDISGQELSEFNGLLQVNKVPSANATILSSGNTITPRIATVAEILNNFNAWESSLVQIKNATVAGAGTPLVYGHAVTDGTGSIDVFTQTYSTFAQFPIPTGPLTVTAIVSDYNGKQLLLRNASDLQ